MINFIWMLCNLFLQEAEAAGVDYDRSQMLETPVDICEAIDRAKARKKNPDPGFSGIKHTYFNPKLIELQIFELSNFFLDFQQATKRTYDRLTKQIKPQFEKYAEQRQKLYVEKQS